MPFPRKLTAAAVAAIRHESRRWGIITQLARRHGVHRETIRRIRQRLVYKTF